MQIKEELLEKKLQNDILRNRIIYLQKHAILYLGTLLTLLFAAYLYIRYAPPQYLIDATILVKEQPQTGYFNNVPLTAYPGDVSISNENDLERLRSRTLLKGIIQELQLYTKYFTTGHLKTGEIFNISPVKLILHKTDFELKKPLSLQFEALEGNQYKLFNDDIDIQSRFNDTILLPIGNAHIIKTGIALSNSKELAIKIESPRAILENYKNYLSISPANKNVNHIRITAHDILPDRGFAIIEQLINHFSKLYRAEKLSALSNTSIFIKDYISIVETDLKAIEGDILRLQNSASITDSKELSKNLIDLDSKLTREIAEKRISAHLIESTIDQLHRTGKVEPTPFASNQQLFHLMKSYEQTQAQLRESAQHFTPNHPSIKHLEQEVAQQKEAILQYLKSYKTEIDAGLHSLETSYSGTTGKLAQIPRFEMKLYELIRQREIQQEIYTYLIKQEIETGMAKSAHHSEVQIIDSPQASYHPSKPNKKLIYSLAFIVSLILPTLYLLLKNLWQNPINSINQLENLLTNASVISSSDDLEYTIQQFTSDQWVIITASELQEIPWDIIRAFEKQFPQNNFTFYSAELSSPNKIGGTPIHSIQLTNLDTQLDSDNNTLKVLITPWNNSIHLFSKQAPISHILWGIVPNQTPLKIIESLQKIENIHLYFYQAKTPYKFTKNGYN